MSEIKLGQKVRDKVTGQEGVTEIKSEYADGDILYSVSYILENGVARSQYINEKHLEPVDE